LTQPGYVCLNCGSPAVDLGEVPAALEEEAREDEASTAVIADVLCPVCETKVQLDVSMECPNCGSPLEVA
jgi:DNA-directed RNA polymerase subunit RPC12/RpoP